MRRVRVLSAALMAALFATGSAKPAAAQMGLEAAVLAEVNFARTHPTQYAERLRRAAERGGPEGYSEIGNEDGDAIDEAIDFLQQQEPLPPLRPNAGLAAAARAHAASQGRTHQIGHVSPGGQTLSQRLHAHGVWAGMAAEDISYGYDNPHAVVRQLIVDSGVPDRGHRQNIFSPSYREAGVSCAPHRAWGAMCVIDFAGAVVRR